MGFEWEGKVSMAGSAFYGYHVEIGADGRARVVRNTAETMHKTGNYYKTKASAMKAVAKHNNMLRRHTKGNPRIPRGKWIPAAIRITKSGSIQARISQRSRR